MALMEEDVVAYGITGVGRGFVRDVDLAERAVVWTTDERYALLCGGVVQARLVQHAVHLIEPDVQVGLCPFFHLWELGGGK